MNKPIRPKPAEIGDVRISVVRGPRHDGKWYWRGRRKGRRDTLWTGWATRREAMAAVARLVAKGLPHPVAPALPEIATTQELLSTWIERQERRADLKPKTVTHYTLCARHLVAWLGELPVTDLNRATLERYRDERLREGASPRAITQEFKRLRSAWAWARDCGLIDGGVLPRVKVRVNGYRINHRTPTPEDVRAVLQHLDGDVLLAVRLLAVTGARISEVCGLRRVDVLVSTSELVLRGKTGPRRFPLPEGVLAVLSRRADGTEASLLALPVKAQDGIRNALTRACADAGVEAFTPHGLRRMVVDRMARRGVDIATAASLTGHSPEVMLRHYRKVTQRDREEAVIKAGLGDLGEVGYESGDEDVVTDEGHTGGKEAE
ncbi:MAG: tyrosine-type recombinase/integrase [Alphaproteobacteria bacterium]|nr:tyrosine-type recombinase/integrase [Alphaproteobacteria bacterium]